MKILKAMQNQQQKKKDNIEMNELEGDASQPSPEHDFNKLQNISDLK